LRRIYKAPELLQLLATFALLLVIKDAALWIWGPEDLLGPRAPGFAGAVEVAGGAFPQYDLLLIVLGPWFLFFQLSFQRPDGASPCALPPRPRNGECAGVNQPAVHRGLRPGRLCRLGVRCRSRASPRTDGRPQRDPDAFVVVVVGDWVRFRAAALLIAEIKAFCIGLGFSEATLVMEFIVMAAVLVLRPWGLLGRMPAEARGPGAAQQPLARPSSRLLPLLVALVAALVLLPLASGGYTLVLLTDVLIFALFAVSLHFIMGPAGLYSFGHAAYFGLGAYAAGIFFLQGKMPMELALALAPLVAGLGALVFGWFCVRLSGVYSAMLTLAFAQIAWSAAFQWDALTGGSNGIVGIWPAPWLA
jgi:branched-chain amino acid transport system permease protein